MQLTGVSRGEGQHGFGPRATMLLGLELLSLSSVHNRPLNHCHCCTAADTRLFHGTHASVRECIAVGRCTSCKHVCHSMVYTHALTMVMQKYGWSSTSLKRSNAMLWLESCRPTQAYTWNLGATQCFHRQCAKSRSEFAYHNTLSQVHICMYMHVIRFTVNVVARSSKLVRSTTFSRKRLCQLSSSSLNVNHYPRLTCNSRPEHMHLNLPDVAMAQTLLLCTMPPLAGAIFALAPSHSAPLVFQSSRVSHNNLTSSHFRSAASRRVLHLLCSRCAMSSAHTFLLLPLRTTYVCPLCFTSGAWHAPGV